MALEDIRMERVPEVGRLTIPSIKAGDLVLVLSTKAGVDWGERLLLCSDGRVAQSDIVVAKPYEVQRQVPLSEEQRGSAEVYAPRVFVDEAIRRGFLKDYVNVFGRDSERDEGEPTMDLEFEILHNGPMVFFGVDLNYAVGSLIRTGEFTSRADGFFNTINPYERGYLEGNRNMIVSCSNKYVREVVVGEEAILSKLRSNPVKFILEKASLKRE